MKNEKTSIMLLLTIALFLISAKQNIKTLVPCDWGAWRTTSCYNGIDFRVRKEATTNIWWVQLRNRYNKKIGIDVGAAVPGGNCKTSDRLTINIGATSETWYSFENVSSIEVCVSNLKWDDEWSNPSVPCGN